MLFLGANSSDVSSPENNCVNNFVECLNSTDLPPQSCKVVTYTHTYIQTDALYPRLASGDNPQTIMSTQGHSSVGRQSVSVKAVGEHDATH